jgi:predicted dithiol-disulfide oxidoreductase (DUF899 family)
MELKQNKVVTHEEWIEARKQLLVKEKEYTRLGDDLARQRRDLPWEPVTKDYVFDGPAGPESLSQLFEGRSQLAVYHFMFGPDWEEGCPACSFWADNFNGIDVHFAERDVSFVVISHAPLAKLERFKRRMGWSFKWVSAGENGFNYDYHASFKPDVIAKGEAIYNYELASRTLPSQYARASEHAGMSVFYKNSDGEIFHTYSAYARGLDTLNGAYRWLDLMPKGRNEEGLPHTMSWVRHHDRYSS